MSGPGRMLPVGGVLERITREYMMENLVGFDSIEVNWTNVGESRWDHSNFLLELPGKWDLSFAILREGRIVGYIIGSKACDAQARVNKIVVSGQHRRRGLGRQLINRFEKECLRKGMCEVELKALVANGSAHRFYTELGYFSMARTEGTDGQMRNVYRKRLG